MPKKILQINKFYDPWVGGIETVVRQIAEGLKQYHEMTILVCDDRIKNQPNTDNSIKIIKAHTLAVVLSMPISWEFFKKFKTLISQNDIFHIHLPFPLGTLAVFLYRSDLKNKKIVATYHSDIVRTKLLGFLYKPLLIWFLKRADAITTTSENLRDGSKILSQFKEKITIIPLAIDYKEQKQSVTKQDYILFVGRLVKYKGLEYLIKALQGTSEKLKIVGSGPLEQNLKKLSKNLNLEKQLEFLGQVSNTELTKLYNEARMFVLPSISNNEAFGIVQLEAMFYSLPIINTFLATGVPWVARNGQEAITVQPKDKNHLRQAILRLSVNPELRERLGSQGKKRLKENFHLNNLLKSFDDLYNKL